MNLRLTPRALDEAKRIKSWWINNRDAKDLFDRELNDTLDAILATPSIGTAYPSDFEVGVRRVLMNKTQNHVYFTVHDGEVVVLSVWGAPKEHGPSL